VARGFWGCECHRGNGSNDEETETHICECLALRDYEKWRCGQVPYDVELELRIGSKLRQLSSLYSHSSTTHSIQLGTPLSLAAGR
jgi:hypothetical protein